MTGTPIPKSHQIKSPNMNIRKQPDVLWAQRSDKVYLTVLLPDAKEIKVQFAPDGYFEFSAVDVNNESCNFRLQFYGSIIPQGTTKMGLSNITCTILKESRGWWKRLLKSEAEPPPFIKVDQYRWHNEENGNLEVAGTSMGKPKATEPDPRPVAGNNIEKDC